MAVPQSKSELIHAIHSNFDKLMRVVQKVPPDKTAEKSLEGHVKNTQICVKDLLAYLTGWNELVIKWLEKDRAGEQIDFPETGFKWNELGKLAQKFYRDYDDLSYDALVLRLHEAKEKIILLIASRTNEALYGELCYTKWTMGRMVQFNTSSPYDNARRRLQTWLKAGSF
ncbi:ClbS/DfsB family four-helix bundle protein [Pseudochrobactrum sp. sp1633]|uniref:ClbS/DfsB family four-helix bundle protein n=1 Tax=Pseudochrobactrum sp. sp1633 TaxID=3036706 RepID=UPI0025A58575|nr:ClbS/DfsB family four-helix bundle protein [Pseudochrobactrum sp. sp1633]MDM8347094.1 ClbS/DfsB family four-helix bundle protein [Pseudochrobactrum sp. sp1633]HWD11854.1 ClbS/DfsB family four-helix bundle protein [Pseudochrobactrum sp.]